MGVILYLPRRCDVEFVCLNSCHGRGAEIDALLRTCHSLGWLYSLGCTWHAPNLHAPPMGELLQRDVISLNQYPRAGQ